MKVLFAVNNENISEAIIKTYQREYKEIITYKNVYYYNAILKELQKDKSYDRVIISEDLEPFSNNNYDAIDKFIFEKLDKISDEATNGANDIPIILICTDRRTKSEPMLVKMFGIGIYNAILGDDRKVLEVCRLLKSPRIKKEAKDYYKIDTDEVGYQSESEDTVSEVELQNILAHYKRLGKDESRYVESFNNIAAQYNDNQLRLIVRVLPISVKAVLEANSPKYQSVMTFRDPQYNQYKKEKEEKKTGGLNIGFIKSNKNKMSKPVVIPSAVDVENVRKIERKTQPVIEKAPRIEERPRIEETPIIKEKVKVKEYNPIVDFNEENEKTEELENQKMKKMQSRFDKIGKELENIVPEVITEPKRGRGRPKKVVETPQEVQIEQPKRGRGRPKKQVEPLSMEGQSKINTESIDLFSLADEEPVPIQRTTKIEKKSEPPKRKTGLFDLSEDEEDDDELDILPDLDEDDDELDNFLPDLDEEDDDELDNFLPDLDDEDEDDELDSVLPGFDDEEDDDEDFNSVLPGFDDGEEEPIISSKTQFENLKPNNTQPKYTQEVQKPYRYNEEPQDYNIRNTTPAFNNQYNSYGNNLDSLLTGDKKIITFVGTSKNGTSFLVNNLGEMFSNMGIKTAILDATKNKNSFYIYTKNEEGLRKIAYSCFENLRMGRAEGIEVNKNLTVYTSLPGEDEKLQDYENILTTLAKNYSVILIDCDFETEAGYFEKSQETYLVQSMDILTIQPLTAFLRDLKSKGVLRPEKLKIVINKEQDVKTLSVKAIVGGLAYYNDPAMSFMTELFNKDTIKYYTVPFDLQVYSRYLEGIVNCEITINRYPKEFIANLKNLAGVVYPLLNNKYSPLNNYGGGRNTFSTNTNNTLNMMKNRY